MFKFFKQLFKKPQSQPKPAPLPRVVETPAPVARVETATLSLLAIVNRFPAELKKTVAKMPDANAMIELPLSTIVKQLPGGSVKMSLASVYRQAPAGTFTATRVEEKRMVEVPLGEIFKRVKPDLLKRRDDQRMHELAEDDSFDVFGDPDNPFAIAPPEPKPEPTPKAELPKPPSLKLATEAPRKAPALEPVVTAPPIAVSPAPVANKTATQPIRTVPAPAFAAGAPAAAPAAEKAAPSGAPLTLPVADVWSGWPDEIREEITNGGGSTVTLPAAPVTAGLAKGKVAFTWGELSQWIEPAISAQPGREGVELQLPLRVIAPAFLKLSKEGGGRKKIALDDSIPTLFSGKNQKPAAKEAAPEPVAEKPKAPIPPPAIEPVAPPAPAPAAEPEPEPAVEPQRVIAGPVIEPIAPPAPEPVVAEAAPAPVEPPPAVVPAPAPAAEAAEAAPATKAPATVGEVFGNPAKVDWSPSEIVQNITKLPQVAGAVVALQEGLVVAHSLPEHMKGDVVAAFLPQIFGRLNQYSGEMKLGEVDDVLMCTHGSYFQIFRLGYVFFAVLGKQGETLPWHDLRLVAEELARQTQK